MSDYEKLAKDLENHLNCHNCSLEPVLMVDGVELKTEVIVVPFPVAGEDEKAREKRSMECQKEIQNCLEENKKQLKSFGMIGNRFNKLQIKIEEQSEPQKNAD